MPLSSVAFCYRYGAYQKRIVAIASTQSEADLTEYFSGKRILLVEDDPINQEVACELLEGVGLVVDIANDGLEAIAAVEKQAYAYGLILMDMQMPKLDGVEATIAIRKLPWMQKTPILAMTANAFSDDRERCLHAGMNDFISKPVNPDSLYDMLYLWLSKSAGDSTRDRV